MGKLEQYEVMKLLGKGSFGSVYCVRRLNDRSLHVMKKISIHNMAQKERVATEQECKVLQRLRHPGIVCYEDSFIYKNRQLCIVMAFCEGGDLSTLIEKRKMRLFPEQEVISWFLQVALALQYMHDEHILHRDLKTQNIFLTKQGIIKLGDFGIAKVLEGTLEMAKTVIGTPYYMSPELFRNQPYSYKSDIWSLGCVLYELVGLRHAFEARDMNSLVQKILRANYAPIPSTASKDVRELIKSMLGLSPSSRPTVNDVLALPFIRKEMGSYIQNQLGDDSVANLLKEDPQLVHFIQQEQSRLEQQARKLGFDVKKRAAKDDDAYDAARAAAAPAAPAVVANAKPSNLSLPTPQEAEKEQVEMREKERQKRAQAFLERELRAKERAEMALKQLQKEKQERLKALQEQREMRQKRMSNVHPRGEAGLMNDWQLRLQQAQIQHEERRRQMGMVPGDHRPKPPPKSKLQADTGEGEARRGVLEAHNHQGRVDKRLKPDPAAEDKENVKNIFDRQYQEVKKKEKEKQEQKMKEAEAAQKQAEREEQKKKELELHQQREREQERKERQEEEEQRRRAEAEAEAARKRMENEKLREEMNRDMQLMEAKLRQLKAKKDAEEARKKAKAAAMSNPGKVEAAVEATKAVQQRAQHQVAAGNLAAQQGAMPQQGVNVMAQHAGNMMQHGANLMPQAPARRDNGPPVRYVDSRDTSRDSNPPVAALAMPHPPRPLGIRASVDSSAHGFGNGMRPAPINVDVVRQSEPHGHLQHFAPPLFAPPAHPPPHRLQAVPSPMAGVGFGRDDLYGEGLGADLISRQKELDRQQARKLVKQDTDREMQEFQMTVHRINKAGAQTDSLSRQLHTGERQAVGGAGASRAMMLPGEVGAKISERDRLLREKQLRDAQSQRVNQGRQGALRGFHDVAHDGALFSPTRKGAFFDGESVDEDIEDELLPQKGHGRMLSPPQEVDEQLDMYDEQEANLEREVAHRTLKIQMLKTALLG